MAWSKREKACIQKTHSFRNNTILIHYRPRTLWPYQPQQHQLKLFTTIWPYLVTLLRFGLNFNILLLRGNNNLWSRVITGSIERQRVWHVIKRASCPSYLVRRCRRNPRTNEFWLHFWNGAARLQCWNVNAWDAYYLANGYYLVTMLQHISGHLMHRIIETCICMQLIGYLVFYVKREKQTTQMLKKNSKGLTFTLVVHLWIVYTGHDQGRHEKTHNPIGAYSSTCFYWDGEDVLAPWE